MKNLFLMFFSIIASFAGGELLLRGFLDEVNYMYPVLERHPELGHAIAAGTGGHDAWGFRNTTVPESADIVAIGDSMTYGYSATASKSWPAQVGRLSGVRVYNLALGGYGPVQYLHLFKDRALSLNPRIVLIGFYLGNDLVDTYRAVNGYDYVAKLKQNEDDGRFLGRLRIWLSQNVLTYQVLKDQLQDLLNIIRFQESLNKPDHHPFDHPVLRTVFQPSCCRGAVNRADPKTQEGLRITLEVFREFNAICKNRKIECKILLLPTKESVYWPIAREALSGNDYEVVSRLVSAETDLRNHLIASLDEIGLSYLDLLPPLRAPGPTEALYLTNEDGHPNGKGYAEIARAVFESLEASLTLMSQRTVAPSDSLRDN